VCASSEQDEEMGAIHAAVQALVGFHFALSY
jgi:hypothetical protein